MSSSSDRSPASSLALNAASIAGGEVISRVAAMASFLLLARYFTPETYGQLAFAATASAMAGPLVDFGLASVAGARIGRDRSTAGRILVQVWSVRASLALLSIAIITGLAAWYEGGALLDVSILFALGLLPAAFTSTWLSFLLGFPQHFLVEKSIQAIVFLGLVVVAVMAGPSPSLVAAAALISAVVAVGSLAPWVIRSCRIGLEWSWNGLRELVAESRHIFLTLLPSTVLLPVASLAVGWLHGTATLGLFWLAARLLLAGPLLGNFAASVVAPSFVAHASDHPWMERARSEMFWRTLAVGLGLSWVTLSSASPLTELLFGPLHSAAAPLVQWTGPLIAAESTSIVIMRLTPYLGGTTQIPRTMLSATAMALLVWVALWPSTGPLAFFVAMGTLHAGMAIPGIIDGSRSAVKNWWVPSTWLVRLLAAVAVGECILFVTGTTPMTALIIRSAVVALFVGLIASSTRSVLSKNDQAVER